jgi:urease accessory protein
MPRVVRVIAAGEPRDGEIVDALLLNFSQRQAAHGTLTGLRGMQIEIPQTMRRLMHEDCLVLDDGQLVEILASPEPLIELRAAGTAALARLAWQIGDRHIPAELHARRLRLRRDPAVEEWLRSIGAVPVVIEAPFEPESGAYTGHFAQR